MGNGPVPDLVVAHGHQRRYQRLHNLRPGLKRREAVGRGLQGGEAAEAGLRPHYVLTGRGHVYSYLPQPLDGGVLT